MILMAPWMFALFAAFAELVGRETAAAINRRKAIEAKKKRIQKRKKKVAAATKARKEKLERKLAAEKEVERKRLIKSKKVQVDLQKQIDGLCDLVAPDAPW